MDYDIVIVGAGPAGANLARLLGEKYKILLLDKRDLSEKSEHHLSKCCGGLLAPDAQKMIAKLGLGIPKDILVNPQLFAVRTLDLTNDLERLYQRFYYNMDREKFDRWMVSIIPSGVHKKYNVVFKGILKKTEGYEARYLQDGIAMSVHTRIIVGADGACSMVRKAIGGSAADMQLYIAIQEWFECSDHIPYYTAIFDEEISDFYSWIIPKEKYLLLGAALQPRDHTWEKYNLLKEKLVKLGFPLEHAIKTEGAHICRPTKLSQFYVGKDHIALVGEAAGAISPSSAEGISYALKSSLYLAESLADGIDGFLERYQKKVADIKLNLLLKQAKCPAFYNPFLRKLAMKSGLQSIK